MNTQDSTLTIPDHVLDLARAALWVEILGMKVETRSGAFDTWFLATTKDGIRGRLREGSVVEAVQAAVGNALREWTEYDHLLFDPQS